MPLAEADLVEHLQVVAGALLDALRLDQFVLALKERDALGQLDLDGLDRVHHGAARRDVMAGRIDGVARHLLQDVAGERIEQRQRFHFVVEQGHAQRILVALRREDVDHVAAHAECAAREIDLVALVLHLDQALDHVALVHLFVMAQMQNHAVVIHRVADAVDRRDGRDDHRVLALQQRLGRGQAHLLDLLVDAGILLDKHVARRHVGLGLVIVVIGDEIFDRVLGQEIAQLGIQLRRQRLVRRHHDRRTAELRDHVGHREGLARAGHAEQRLERQAVADALDQLRDGRGLVARRLERLVQDVGAVGEGDDGHGQPCIVRANA